jgi:hypothetical protein
MSISLGWWWDTKSGGSCSVACKHSEMVCLEWRCYWHSKAQCLAISNGRWGRIVACMQEHISDVRTCSCSVACKHSEMACPEWRCYWHSKAQCLAISNGRCGRIVACMQEHISDVRTCSCSVACVREHIIGVWKCSCSMACMKDHISGVRTCSCSMACTKEHISCVWIYSCSLVCMKENTSGV